MGDEARFPKRFLVVALAGFAIWLLGSWMSSVAYPPLPYSELSTLIQRDEVASVEVRPHALLVKLKHPRDGKTQFLTERVDLTLAEQLDKHGVRYFAGEDRSDLWSWVLWAALPLALIVGLRAMMMMRGSLGAGMGPGAEALNVAKSKARVYVETNTRVTFSDVAGVDEAKHELQEIVEYLRDPVRLGRLGARMPKGVLLVGPPGTGKTLLARAVAGEAGVPFFSINGSEFVELFVGVGAARVRDLFAQARSRAPSIIFIDELDALGRARNAMPYMAGHDEKEQTLNQLLSELDGFDTASGLVLLAATNRPEILDPALLRSGRFDRQVLVDRPDRHGRAEILAIHTRKLKCAPELSLEDVAALTPGFTGADLSNLCNEAALTATRRGAAEVQLEDFTQAVERIVAGLEKKHRLLHPLERKVVAYHECGHALVGTLLLQGERIQKVSIIPRGIGALGYTLQRPLEDRYLMTRDELDNKLAVLMGGRAAEQLMLGRMSTGAADDLAKATELARSMATRYGMVQQLGHMAYDLEPPSLLGTPSYPGYNHAYSEHAAHKVEAAIKEILDTAFSQARAILASNRAIVEATAAKLLEQETLSERELQDLFSSAKLPDADAHADTHMDNGNSRPSAASS